MRKLRKVRKSLCGELLTQTLHTPIINKNCSPGKEPDF